MKWKKNCQRYLWKKGNDFRASGLGQVRRLTAASAAITLARLFLEMLCYVLGRLHSSCVLSTRTSLRRIEVIHKTKTIIHIYSCLLPPLFLHKSGFIPIKMICNIWNSLSFSCKKKIVCRVKNIDFKI